MIGTIVIPTPRIIKRKFKYFINKYSTKERILIYTLISGGLIAVSKVDIPSKPFIFGSLIYNGVAFEILEKWFKEVEKDKELKEILLHHDIFGRIRITL
ncbi:MAG: hypothetical protein ACRC7R_00670 [Sarcina sp.]